MSKRQTNSNRTAIRWTGMCNCGNKVFARAPVEDTAGNNEGIHSRCGECESTVFLREQWGTV